MQVLKFGTINPIVFNVIFGLLDAFYIKCVLFDLLLKEKIWMLFIKKFKDVSIKKYPKDTLHNCNKLYQCA